MRAISLWQPWATLMALGFKRNETRSWATSYRGLLAIHAAKKRFREADYDPTFVRQVYEYLNTDDLDYGAILCVVELTACMQTRIVRDCISERERMFGNYDDGRFAWLTEHKRLLEPIPFRGAQGFFNWPDGDCLYISRPCGFQAPAATAAGSAASPDRPITRSPDSQ